jgi:excisionase family DNA binding protein
MTLAARLRALVEAADPSGSVTLTVSWLRDQLDADQHPEPEASVDLTVDRVCELVGRKPETVRRWCRDGDLPGAYLLHGREWRVPQGAIEAMQAAQREARERERHEAEVQRARRIRRNRDLARAEAPVEPFWERHRSQGGQ